MDISMCQNASCKVKNTCKRNPESGSKPSEFWQSWSNFCPNPIDNPAGCEYYWPIEIRSKGKPNEQDLQRQS